ncbi:50S ribosomal protein L33 [Gammaproteobacteria bacterium]|jgi:large subunit ribosomal protein L33|nr:50S ribosomal protein L33 [Gammaproteobacteria bacterium]
MAASKRDIVRLQSEADTGYCYYVSVNLHLQEEKLRLKKYDPKVRKHVWFKQKKKLK